MNQEIQNRHTCYREIWVANFFRLQQCAFTGCEDKPFICSQWETRTRLKEYNYKVSKHKNIIEHVNGIITMQWGILQTEFRYKAHFFPAVFRCCCTLTNMYFRLYGYPNQL